MPNTIHMQKRGSWSLPEPIRFGGRTIGLKRILWVSTILIFVLFWDSLLPHLAHGAHVVIEVVELALEHALEHAFHLTPRQAQTVLAWSALGIVIYLLYWSIRKAWQIGLRLWTASCVKYDLAKTECTKLVANATPMQKAASAATVLLVIYVWWFI